MLHDDASMRSSGQPKKLPRQRVSRDYQRIEEPGPGNKDLCVRWVQLQRIAEAPPPRQSAKQISLDTSKDWGSAVSMENPREIVFIHGGLIRFHSSTSFVPKFATQSHRRFKISSRRWCGLGRDCFAAAPRLQLPEHAEHLGGCVRLAQGGCWLGSTARVPRGTTKIKKTRARPPIIIEHRCCTASSAFTARSAKPIARSKSCSDSHDLCGVAGR